VFELIIVIARFSAAPC